MNITRKEKKQIIMGKLSEEFYSDFTTSLKDAEKIKRIAEEIAKLYD